MAQSFRPSFQIEKLNNDNYAVWKFRVKQMLVNLEIWSVVNEEVPEAPDAAWKRKDDQASSTIGLLVDDNQLVHIINSKTAREAWINLEGYHQKSSEASIVHLYRTLCRMRLNEDGNMEDHVNKVQDTINRLNALGEEIRDKFAAAMLLETLPDSYDTLVTMLEGRQEGLSLSLAKSKLIDEYKRRKNKMALNEDNCISESAMKAQVTSQKECYFCKRKGHFKKECEKYIAWKQKQDKANKVTHVDEDHFVFTTKDYMCSKVNRESVKDYCWIMDSGATSHMCNNREFFENLSHEKRGKVQFADKEGFTDVEGIGFGTLKLINNGKEISIKVTDVLYVPKLSSSLLSVTKLIEKGFSVQFKDSICSVISPTDGKVKATAVLTENKLFQLQTEKCTNERKVIKIKKDVENTQGTGQLKGTRTVRTKAGMKTQAKGDNKGVNTSNVVCVEWFPVNPNEKDNDEHQNEDQEHQVDIISGRETSSESVSESSYSPESYESFNDDENYHDSETVLRRSNRENKGIPPEIYMDLSKVLK